MFAPFPKVQAFLLSVMSVYVLWYLPISAPIVALWHLYEPKVAAQLKASSPRLYGAICIACHTTLQLVPLLKFAFMFFAGRPWGASSPILSSNPNTPPMAARKVPPLPILLALALAFVSLSCGAQLQSVSASGSVTASPSGNITGTIGVVIDFAGKADSQLRPVVDSDTQLTPEQRAQADADMTAAANSLAELRRIDNTVQAVIDAPTRCRLVAAIDAVINDRMNAMTLLLGFGVAIPLDAQLAVEAIGAIADALIGAVDPGCSSGAPARHGSRLDMIRARLDIR